MPGSRWAITTSSCRGSPRRNAGPALRASASWAAGSQGPADRLLNGAWSSRAPESWTPPERAPPGQV